MHYFVDYLLIHNLEQLQDSVNGGYAVAVKQLPVVGVFEELVEEEGHGLLGAVAGQLPHRLDDPLPNFVSLVQDGTHQLLFEELVKHLLVLFDMAHLDYAFDDAEANSPVG